MSHDKTPLPELIAGLLRHAHDAELVERNPVKAQLFREAAERLAESVPRDVIQPFLAACIESFGSHDGGGHFCRMCGAFMPPGSLRFPHEPDCQFQIYDAYTAATTGAKP